MRTVQPPSPREQRSLLHYVRTLLLLASFASLAACDSVVLNPSGDVAAQQRDLLVTSTYLMLLIIVPVMALTVIFAWRYRQGNAKAQYDPHWHHSTSLELVIWAAPLLIVICLGALTWLGTHLLDPYRPLDRIQSGQPVTADMQPLQVNVVALDWKWLFIYPELGVATINELAVPVNRPLSLRITSATVMNSLYIPELAGQIYAMPGMETRLHGVLNRPGVSQGFSSNYSGAGFSGMKFTLRGLWAGEFDKWVATAKAADGELTRAVFLELEKPSERERIRHFASVDASLYDAILGMCVATGRMCRHDMMAIDKRGGLGTASAYNVAPFSAGQRSGRAPFGAAGAYVVGMCTNNDPPRTLDAYEPFEKVDRSPLVGAGLRNPQLPMSRLLAGGAQDGR